MARDLRFQISVFQAIRLLFLMPPIALYLLIKTCFLRLLLKRRERRAQPPAAPDGPSQWDVVCLSHVNWEHIWQRNHHTMSGLSRRSKVLYINPVRLDAHLKHAPLRRLSFRRVRPNLWHAEWFVLPFETQSRLFQQLNRFLLETRIRYWMQRLGFGPIVLWFYFPSQAWLAGCLGERAVVYDIQDEYSHFCWAPRDTAEKERFLLDKADVIFAGTDALFERKRAPGRNIHFFACGVDVEHFGNLYHRDRPHDLRHLRGSATLGYFGAIDDRIDSDLLQFIARERPDWNLVMIGPIFPNVFRLFSAPNVVFTGARRYELLPRYLSCFDVCLMPFKLNELTAHINPTKALEYFASGKPVVSTPIPDMVKHYSDVIYFADTPEQFLAQCERALRDFPPERRDRGVRLAAERSWETVVASMRNVIDAAIAKRP